MQAAAVGYPAGVVHSGALPAFATAQPVWSGHRSSAVRSQSPRRRTVAATLDESIRSAQPVPTHAGHRVALSAMPVPVQRAGLALPVVQGGAAQLLVMGDARASRSPQHAHQVLQMGGGIANHHQQSPNRASSPTKETPGDGEFMKLLDSLEVRVDLMAQMQHTRNQIQARTRVKDEPDGQGAVAALQGLLLGEGTHVMTTPPGDARPLPGGTISPLTIAALAQAQQQLEARAALPRGGAVHADASAELRERLDEERGRGDALRHELGALRMQAHDADDLRERLSQALERECEASAQVDMLRQQLHEARMGAEASKKEWASEWEQMAREIESLRSGQAKNASSRADTATLPTEPVLIPPTMRLAEELAAQETQQPPTTAPFNRQACGVNVVLSEDGYTATRTRGCRQSVLVGSAPLARQPLGWYFEVTVQETVEGWVGGLGLGFTLTSPSQLRRVPDKAWRMPHTYIVGYWGCVFLDGKERSTRWRADALPVGARVGALVSGDGSGDLRIFVDGTLVVHAEGALQEHVRGPGPVELFPVVDVFAATLSVELQALAAPPAPPWGDDVSPPGSPTGSLVGVSPSMRG